MELKTLNHEICFKKRYSGLINHKECDNEGNVISYNAFYIDFKEKQMFNETLKKGESLPKFQTLFKFCPVKVTMHEMKTLFGGNAGVRWGITFENNKGKEWTCGSHDEWSDTVTIWDINSFLMSKSLKKIEYPAPLIINSVRFYWDSDEIYTEKTYCIDDFPDDSYWDCDHEDYIFRENKPSRKSNKYRNWRKRIIERDGSCVCCGSDDDLQVHHINGFSEYPDLAYDVDNGVLLCKRCHDIYHGVYGKQDITGEKFELFMDRFGV